MLGVRIRNNILHHTYNMDIWNRYVIKRPDSYTPDKGKIVKSLMFWDLTMKMYMEHGILIICILDACNRWR